MRMHTYACLILGSLFASAGSHSQVVLSGRVMTPKAYNLEELVPLSNIFIFASLEGPNSQALGHRTFEMEPAGWYRVSGGAGNYTMLYSNTASYMRPFIYTNVFTRDGDIIDWVAKPSFTYAVFEDSSWEEKAGHAYFQTFVATGASVTHVGFRLAHDGVDGEGPGSQTLLISVHRQGKGDPDTWPQVGPVMAVLQVDCGGPKGYVYSAGFNSGEVPTAPGETYAVQLRAESPTGVFQPYWRIRADQRHDCFRVGPDGKGFTGREMWLAISSDNDGLLIPYHKQVQKEFGEMTRFGRKWTQTYVAQGHSLAGVILYAAWSGTQPSLRRQRVALRVRERTPTGPLVGIEKIGIGNGIHTGDASWGAVGVAFAPGEVPLEPGETYALEFETIETPESIGDYVDIKGRPSDRKPGFQPYRKIPPDDYPLGKAYFEGREAVEYDLDMQVIEYEHTAENWREAVTGGNLLRNGDMEQGADENGAPAGWTPYKVVETTSFLLSEGDESSSGRFVRVMGGGVNGLPVDGGWVQRADGLSRWETYRLSGKLRCSYIVDDQHACMIGYDPTGKTTDPAAASIEWATLPLVHGLFVPYQSPPIRPRESSISVWLRARTTMTVDYLFKADFDDFALRQVDRGVPQAAAQ